MNLGFNLYLLFVISWFSHLSARLKFLGTMRFDLILIVLLTIIIVLGNKDENLTSEIKSSKIHKIISLLLVYIVVTLPFVEWPGSVMHSGLENFVKAVVFYYFTIYFVNDERKLRLFVIVFLGCQCFRILEPVYLHITQGYWGSFASMENWEYLERLSGAPDDVVNPNGLAFIALTVIPFLYYLFNVSKFYKIAATLLIPVSIYALVLTGSRSGMVGLFAVLIAIFFKSKNKVFVLLLICIGMSVALSHMGADSKDRFASIFVSGTKSDEGTSDRLIGTKIAFKIALKKPLFGYGIGTSREANANFGTYGDKPTHDLYGEIAIELGFIGLAMFLFLMKEIVLNYNRAKNIMATTTFSSDYLPHLTDAAQAWLVMNIIFSFASFGLSSYEWYLFAGLSSVLYRIVDARNRSVEAEQSMGLGNEYGGPVLNHKMQHQRA
jgi:putative inorganic carbon (hco3(-)) transporter